MVLDKGWLIFDWCNIFGCEDMDLEGFCIVINCGINGGYLLSIMGCW